MAMKIEDGSLSQQARHPAEEIVAPLLSQLRARAQSGDVEKGSDVLQLTYMVRNRAEVAAMQMTGRQNLEDVAAMQAISSAIREIRGIVLRISELSGQAANKTSDLALSSIQSETRKLDQQIKNILSTQNPSAVSNTQSDPSEKVIRDTMMRVFSLREDEADKVERGRKSSHGDIPDIHRMLSETLQSLDLSNPEGARKGLAALSEVQVTLDEVLMLIDRQIREIPVPFVRKPGGDISAPSGMTFDKAAAQGLTDFLVETIMMDPETASMAQVNMIPSPPTSLLR